MEEKRAWAQVRERAREAAMHERTRAREAAAHAQARMAARREAEAGAALEVIPWLRKFGFGMDEARRAAAVCAGMPEARLEERVRRTLSSLRW